MKKQLNTLLNLSRHAATLANKPTTWAMVWITFGMTTPAHAGIFDGMTTTFCAVLGQLVGPRSTILSLVLIGVTALMLVLWWVNESKEGMVVFILKSATVVGVMINIFSVPTYLGMAPVSC